MEMELSWSDSELALSEFVKTHSLPQIVQIGEGAYGQTEETTLSRGQQLNLHLLKDTEFFSGISETGNEVLIPLSSPHKVHVYAEKSLDYDSPAELSSLFPKKYKHVRVPTVDEDLYEVVDDPNFETIKALFFDKNIQSLVCLDKGGCEILLSLQQLETVKVLERTEEPVFMAEVKCQFTLPLTVQFAAEVNSAVNLTRGVIDLKEVIQRKTVVATSRDADCRFVLTFLDTLDVTVIPLEQSTLTSPEYQNLVRNLTVKMDFRNVEKNIEEDDGIYEDVESCGIKVHPYAETLFSQSRLSSSSSELDSEGYIKMNKGSECQKKTPGLATKNKPTCFSTHPVSPGIIAPCSSFPRVILPDATSLRSPQTEKSRFSPKKTKKENKRNLFCWKSSSAESPKASRATASPKTIISVYEPNKEKRFNDNESDDDDGYELPVNPPRRMSSSSNCYVDIRKEVKKNNKKVEDLTVAEVGLLLRELNLAQYGNAFKKEQVDGRMLKVLDKQMLQTHFKMTSFHAVKLLKGAMENWRPAVGDR